MPLCEYVKVVEMVQQVASTRASVQWGALFPRRAEIHLGPPGALSIATPGAHRPVAMGSSKFIPIRPSFTHEFPHDPFP